MVRKFDFLVIGSGIAGMSFALKVAHKGTVALICMKIPDSNNKRDEYDHRNNGNIQSGRNADADGHSYRDTPGKFYFG